MSGLKTSRLDTLGHILENVRWWLWEVPVGVKGTKEQGSGSQLLCSPWTLGRVPGLSQLGVLCEDWTLAYWDCGEV